MELRSLEDTLSFSKNISKVIKAGDVIFLYGEIGTGKTTFVRFLINHLEVENKVKKSDILSPTFNIVYDYQVGKIKIYHYDLYRIKNIKELEELDFFENINKSITIIEWPELLIDLPFKKKHYLINLDLYSENKRAINIKYFE
mgnify:CR=1 FL=1